MMNRTSGYDFTIIVPVYNEEDCVDSLGSSLRDYLPHCPVKACVLFVDDGSTDRSPDKLKELCCGCKDFFCISLESNSGLSAALKAGFDHCFSKYCGYMDADLQTSPEDFSLLLEKMEDCQMATGVRTGRADSAWRKFQSGFANAFRRLFTRDGASDTCCPLKVFQTDVVKDFPVFNGMHRFFPALVKLQGGSFVEVPVRHYPRVAGKSKFGLRNRLFGPLADCIGYCWLRGRHISYKVKSGDF